MSEKFQKGDLVRLTDTIEVNTYGDGSGGTLIREGTLAVFEKYNNDGFATVIIDYMDSDAPIFVLEEEIEMAD